jgi:2-polyprenyl-3-methyl-5-hydroxy-6-metoxy-1,4-benzoquinol methylase
MFKCKICENTQAHQLVFAREMMFGFRDKFLYFKCPVCGCLQISEIPNDLSKYYPQNYYSYQQNTVTSSKFKRMVKRFLVNAYMRGLTVLKYGPHLRHFDVSKLILLGMLKNFNKRCSILDIGCGVGNLLLEMRNWGYSNLTGIDPFIEKDILYPSGVKIFKQTISEHNDRHDFIMLHHSFEHMPDPHAALKDIHKILKDDGLLLIRIPVSDSYAFRKYQNNWYQLDAPRHFFLHTTNSISYLAKNNSFVVKDIIYDSNEHPILHSENYIRDIKRQDQIEFSPSYIKKCRQFTKLLNERKDGDQCCFVLSNSLSN